MPPTTWSTPMNFELESNRSIQNKVLRTTWYRLSPDQRRRNVASDDRSWRPEVVPLRHGAARRTG